VRHLRESPAGGELLRGDPAVRVPIQQELRREAHPGVPDEGVFPRDRLHFEAAAAERGLPAGEVADAGAHLPRFEDPAVIQ